jgi:hypothetical protein
MAPTYESESDFASALWRAAEANTASTSNGRVKRTRTGQIGTRSR